MPDVCVIFCRKIVEKGCKVKGWPLPLLLLTIAV
jgi:hypothetical protein